jgi:hypothetical protein
LGQSESHPLVGARRVGSTTMEGLMIIPPRSVVRVVRVTESESAWSGYIGRVFRIGYYSKQDGLDCVWLVADDGAYLESVDQEMIRTHFEVLERSEETDLF